MFPIKLSDIAVLSPRSMYTIKIKEIDREVIYQTTKETGNLLPFEITHSLQEIFI